MLEALVFGVVASSALVIGGAVGAFWRAPTQLTGAFLALASGSLISALCFELFPEAVELGGVSRAGVALVPGAATFIAANTLLDKYVAPPERGSTSRAARGRTRRRESRRWFRAIGCCHARRHS